MSEPRPTGWPGGPVEPPTIEAIEVAARRLEGTIVRTPLLPLVSHGGGTGIYLKPEALQPVGSF
ncbi:MAG: threonine/serine dehydratase, partial [Acidimicrobiia bacterium]